MGSIKVRNLFLSKKLKLSETRLLIIDDNQIRYNEILNIFQSKNHLIKATLLDDLNSFEKQLNASWDLVIFGQAYDLKMEQAITLIHASSHIDMPVLLLQPQDYDTAQYQSFIHKGIYDVVDPNNAEHFYIGALRALSYSRTLQTQRHLLSDLDLAKNQAQALVEEQNKAVAVIQEGIHSQANAEYLKLFGLDSEDDLIGIPLLDILQPSNVNEFRTRFKKIAQGQFDLGRFEIDTQNPQAQNENPLKLEFLPSEEEDAVQLVIETASSVPATIQTESVKTTSNQDSVFNKIHRHLIHQPANANALVVFSLAHCPDEVLQLNWETINTYLHNLREFVHEQTNQTVFKINTALYAIVIQAESEQTLTSRVSALSALEKPQLLTVNNSTFPLHLKLGSSNFKADALTESTFSQILAQAYNTPLPKRESASDLQLEATLQETVIELLPVDLPTSPALGEIQLEAHTIEPKPVAPQLNIEPVLRTSPVLTQIQQKLEKGEINLKFQQLYDKQDTSLYTFEVTSGFIFENQWKKVSSLIELDEDAELSIKLDRWILVEACKQLHNFITQSPEAKLVVNLNRHILFQDKQFPELVSKLITIIGSRLAHPLILQFDEDDIAKNLIDAQKQFTLLREFGAEIAIRNFGSSISSESIIKQTDITLFSLHEKYTQMLNSDTTLAKLQETIEVYHAIKPVELLLKNLNDMNAFANSWNVDVRFLQGEYFQKKMDHLTDVQDQ